MKACFFNLPVPTTVFQTPYLIDHRFFFQHEDGTGGYSCGVVRRVVAEALTLNRQYLSNSNFLELLPTVYNNPSMAWVFMAQKRAKEEKSEQEAKRAEKEAEKPKRKQNRNEQSGKDRTWQKKAYNKGHRIGPVRQQETNRNDLLCIFTAYQMVLHSQRPQRQDPSRG